MIKCGKCNKDLPVTSCRETIIDSGYKMLIEALCPVCKVEVKHEENLEFARVSNFCVVEKNESASLYTKFRVYG
jgi:phage FluMu protein Com